MSGDYHIRPEWVEAAEKALVPNWKRPSHDADEARHQDALTVLAAVVPAIQAQALRDWIAEWPTTPDRTFRLADAAFEGLHRADLIERGELP